MSQLSMGSNLGTPDGHAFGGQEFGQEFVWCVEHERPVSKCRQLAIKDYGQAAFDNCQWITEGEMPGTCEHGRTENHFVNPRSPDWQWCGASQVTGE